MDTLIKKGYSTLKTKSYFRCQNEESRRYANLVVFSRLEKRCLESLLFEGKKIISWS